MYCPNCRVEYIASATMCSDCQVPLVAELPSAAPSLSSYEKETFVLLWSGMDPQRKEEVCDVLEHAQIPFRIILKDDHLVSPSMQPAFKVFVPTSLAAKGDALLKADPLLADDDAIDEAGVSELPEEEYDPNEEQSSRSSADWHPDDATVEIWSGDAVEMAEMIAASLRENQIRTRRNDDVDDEDFSEETPGPEVPPYKLFVVPDDEKRALEIVHEIVDAEPPE